MNNELMRALIGLLFHITGFVSALQLGEKVANLRLSIFYHNPEHEAVDGYCDRDLRDNWCDTYFDICVSTFSSADCNIFSHTTDTHDDLSYIEYDGENVFRVPLVYPIPRALQIAISAYDADRFTSHDFIATFKNDVVEVPPSNIGIDANLTNSKSTEHNKNVNITAFLSLECMKGFYGETCSIECVVGKHPSVIGCQENGTSICISGFRGQFCDKPDACYYKPCIVGAECINVDTTTGYKCICEGIEGLHCRARYNPCVPSQCQNQGRCARTGEKHGSFICMCPMQWTGKLCDVKRSPCEMMSQKLANVDLVDENKVDNYSFISEHAANKGVPVCKNGGVCVDLMDTFGYICNCTRGWKGKFCMFPDWTNAIISGCVVTGLLMILVCAIIPCCLRMRVLQLKKSQITSSPLVYSHGSTKYPVTEHIPFKEVFYNSVIQADTLESRSSEGRQPFYEYCTVDTPSFSEGEMVTFTSNDYETLTEDKPPPELPIRPDDLAPLPKLQNAFAFQDFNSLPASRPVSLYSRQPLLTPQNSDFSLPQEIDFDYKNDALPRRSLK